MCCAARRFRASQLLAATPNRNIVTTIITTITTPSQQHHHNTITSTPSHDHHTARYFQAVAGFTAPEVLLDAGPPTQSSSSPGSGSGSGSPGAAGNPLAGLFAKAAALFGRAASDPFYAVVAYKGFKREDA